MSCSSKTWVSVTTHKNEGHKNTVYLAGYHSVPYNNNSSALRPVWSLCGGSKQEPDFCQVESFTHWKNPHKLPCTALDGTVTLKQVSHSSHSSSSPCARALQQSDLLLRKALTLRTHARQLLHQRQNIINRLLAGYLILTLLRGLNFEGTRPTASRFISIRRLSKALKQLLMMFTFAAFIFFVCT